MALEIRVYQIVKDAPVADDKVLIVVMRGTEIVARKVVAGRLA